MKCFCLYKATPYCRTQHPKVSLRLPLDWVHCVAGLAGRLKSFAKVE